MRNIRSELIFENYAQGFRFYAKLLEPQFRVDQSRKTDPNQTEHYKRYHCIRKYAKGKDKFANCDSSFCFTETFEYKKYKEFLPERPKDRYWSICGYLHHNAHGRELCHQRIPQFYKDEIDRQHNAGKCLDDMDEEWDIAPAAEWKYREPTKQYMGGRKRKKLWYREPG